MGEKQDLIEQLAAEMGWNARAIMKWRQRHVPHSARLPLSRLAALRGVILTDEDFLLSRKIARQRRRKV